MGEKYNMYQYFNLVKKEFSTVSYVSVEKVEKVRKKHLSYNVLNQHEKNILDYGYSLIMITYTTFQASIVSHYIIEFDENQLLDIYKINLENKKNGYFLHSVSLLSGNQNKEDNYKTIIQKIIHDDCISAEFQDIGYADHHDLAFIINPRQNNTYYKKQNLV